MEKYIEKYLGVYVNANVTNGYEMKSEQAVLMHILKTIDGNDALIRYIGAIVSSAEKNIQK